MHLRVSFIGLAIAFVAQGATIIPGGNVLNTTWMSADSPYILLGDVTIPAGSSLAIESGVEVHVASGDAQGAGLDPDRVEFTVNGSLVAHGRPANRIVFRAEAVSGSSTWYGMVVGTGATVGTFEDLDIRNARFGLLASNTTFEMRHVTISFCDTGMSVNGGSIVLGDSRFFSNRVALAQAGSSTMVSVGNSLITSSEIGFDVRGGSLLLHSSTVATNQTGLLVSDSGWAIATDSVVARCATGVLVSNAIAGIERCSFFGNGSGFASVALADIALLNSVLYNNTNAAILMASTGAVESCTLHGNGIAIEASDSHPKTLVNSLITSNRIGIVNSGTVDSVSTAALMFWGNATNQVGLVLPTPLRVLDPAYGNISGPDGLMGTQDDSFAISAGSPAIDAGDTSRNRFGGDFLRAPRVLDDPATADAGAGPPPVIDIGSFEYQPALRFTGIRLTNGIPSASFNTFPGRSYRLEHSTNLISWTSNANATGNGTIVTIPDPAATNSPQRVYRLRQLP